MAVNPAIGLATQPTTMPETGLLGERPIAGDFATAAWNVYRRQFKLYVRLSLQAHLWLLLLLLAPFIITIPASVFGCAKFCAGLGAIARLACNEAMDRAEPLSDTLRVAEAKKWNILLAGFLFFLLFGALAGVAGIVLLLLVGATVGIGGNTSATVGVILGSSLAILSIVGLAGLYWLFARLFLIELPLIVEPDPDPAQAIGRSWQITKSSAWRIITVMFVASLLTLPIGFIVQGIFALGDALLEALRSSLPALSSLTTLLTRTLYIVTSLAPTILFMPFWQILKGLVYADLRDRREGWGLQLACEKQYARHAPSPDAREDG